MSDSNVLFKLDYYAGKRNAGNNLEEIEHI